MRPFKGTPLWGGPLEKFFSWISLEDTEQLLQLRSRVTGSWGFHQGFRKLLRPRLDSQHCVTLTAKPRKQRGRQLEEAVVNQTKPVQERGHSCCRHADP